MGTFFGKFLIDKKMITEEQLKKALSLQKEERYELKDIANFSGKLTEKQIDMVFRGMKEEKYAGKEFCEVALEMNLITPNDVQDIMVLENEINIRIGKVLVELGHMKEEECHQCLTEFNNA